MIESKMAAVAALFGKKLGEHFPVNTGGYPYREPVVTARFTRKGVEFYYSEKECWLGSIDILLGLLDGGMEVVGEGGKDD